MSSNLIWAIPVAAMLFGCAHEKRQAATPAQQTTTTTVERQGPQLTAPSATGGGPRDDVEDSAPGKADRMVESRKDELRRACYWPAAGMVSFVIDVTIAPDGRVERANTVSVDGNPNVAECVRGRIEQMTFPQTAERAVHTFTFLFAK